MLTKKDLLAIGKIVDIKINEAYKLLQRDMIDLFTSAGERLDTTSKKLDQKIDKVSDSINQKIDRVSVRLDQRMDRLEINFNRKMDGLDQRIGAILDHLKDHHIMAMDQNKRISKLEEKVYTTTSA